MIEDIYFHEKYKMWWPKFDHKPDGNHHMIQSGIGAIDLVRKYCKKFDFCIQAGGHLGYWPNKLAQHFKEVHTFEADPIVFECLEGNIKFSNIFTYKSALGATSGTLEMRRGSSAGSTRAEVGGKLKIAQFPLDALFDNCDALLLDIEGGELDALKGAKFLIENSSPVILVEELIQHKGLLWEYLNSINYKRVDGCGKDGIWIRA